jgi:hypothetical protein
VRWYKAFVRQRRIIVAATALAVLAGAWVLLFPRRTRQDDTWGRTTVISRWGIEREVRIDRDLDGRVDVRIRYPGQQRQIATHDRPSEIWVDTDLDGSHDVHWKDGKPPVLERGIGTARYDVIRGAAADLPNGQLAIRTRRELGL